MARYTTKQLATLFANRDVNSAESHGGASFVNGKYLSYGVPVAEITGPFKARVTSRKYSVTTSKHTSQVEQALVGAGFEVVREDF